MWSGRKLPQVKVNYTGLDAYAHYLLFAAALAASRKVPQRVARNVERAVEVVSTSGAEDFVARGKLLDVPTNDNFDQFYVKTNNERALVVTSEVLVPSSKLEFQKVPE